MVPCRTVPLPSGRTRRATRNSLPTQPCRMYLPNRSRVPGAPVAAGSILIFSSASFTPRPVSGRAWPARSSSGGRRRSSRAGRSTRADDRGGLRTDRGIADRSLRSSYWSSPIHPASCSRHHGLVAANSNAVVVYRGGIQPISRSAAFIPRIRGRNRRARWRPACRRRASSSPPASRLRPAGWGPPR